MIFLSFQFSLSSGCFKPPQEPMVYSEGVLSFRPSDYLPKKGGRWSGSSAVPTLLQSIPAEGLLLYPSSPAAEP
jgi:hypothetical protein